MSGARVAALAALVLGGVVLGAASGALSKSAEKNPVDADGTIAVPAFSMPFSSLASPEAKAGFPAAAAMSRQAMTLLGGDIATARKRLDETLFLPLIEKQKARYKVTVTPETIAGIYTDVVLPAEGVARENRKRVLINLHGGGFVVGARTAGLVEAIPIAAVAQIKVVTVDYRQGPEHVFPAASEDVAAVYRALLKDYKPRDIGIYGCSAGGALAAEAIAWFDKEGLPQPGAIGIFCASAGLFGRGDSHHFATPLMGGPAPPAKEDEGFGPRLVYFKGADPASPLVAPVNAPELLAKFPPTLFITGTRAFELSVAVDSHRKLTKAGVEARLHVWDGMGHAFLYDPDLPESREAYDVAARFFRAQLGRH
jgi:acetyl esterase/lipase